MEEASIRDRDQQWYIIKQIDGGTDTAKIVAQLDLDDWKSTMLLNYTNGSATLDATITAILPAGWSLVDNTGIIIRRTVEEGNYTPFEVLEQCRDIYGVYFRFDNVAKTVTVIQPNAGQPVGAFATRDLNLKEINYKGKSNDFVTRLYAYGANGLSFASINNGLPYVDNNTYSSKIICAVWQDDRYTVAENLLEDAISKLAEMAVPTRSYDCDVVDLRATNPEMYGFLNFEIFSVATLIDDSKNFAVNYQVVERWDYPYYPEKNKVVFSTSPAKIQSQIAYVTNQIENTNSAFQQQQTAAINNATKWLTSSDGYVMAVVDEQSGAWKEILFLDTPSAEDAKNVLRINTNGLGFSTTGVNGPYTNAWTIDGNLVASFITTGILKSADEKTYINLDTGAGQFTGKLVSDSLDLVDAGTGVKYGTFYLGTHTDGSPAPAFILYDVSGTQVAQIFTDINGNPNLILKDSTNAQIQMSCSGNNAFLNVYGTGSNALKSNINFKSAAGFLLGDSNEDVTGHQFWLDTNKNAHLETDYIMLSGKNVYVDGNGFLKVPTT